MAEPVATSGARAAPAPAGFATARPLRFGDCDLSGIAYFPAFLNLLVGVVEEFFESLGAPWPTLFGARRIGTPTVRLEVDFLSPGRHGDRLDFAVTVTAVGRSSLELVTTVASAGRTLWRARQVLVATSLDTHASLAWPDDLRAALTARLETPHAHGSAT